MNFVTFLRDYRALVKKGEEAKLQRMLLLVEIKPLSAIWRTGPYTSWESLLRAERLAPVAYFRAFEQATRVLDKRVIAEVGADVAVILVRIEEHLRKPILAQVRMLIQMQHVPPPRALVWAWVKALRYMPPPKMTRKGLQSRVQH